MLLRVQGARDPLGVLCGLFSETRQIILRDSKKAFFKNRLYFLEQF